MPTDANTLIPSLWATLQQPAPTNTWPLGSPALAWSNIYLGNGIPALDTLTGNIGYVAPTAQEIAAAAGLSVSITNFVSRGVYAAGDVRRYGGDSTGGVASDTAWSYAVAQASQSGGAEITAPGIYLINSGIVVSASGVKIRSAGMGSTYLKAGAAGISVLKVAGSNCTVESLLIDGNGNATVDGLVLAPANEASTTVVTQNNFNTFRDITIQNCNNGRRLRGGPTVAGTDSGCFYNMFYGVFELNCVRSVWMQNSVNNGHGAPNRCNFYGCRGGSAGSVCNTGLQIDAGGTNSFFGVAYEGMANGTSPSAIPTAVVIANFAASGVQNIDNHFFGCVMEANTLDLNNTSTTMQIYGGVWNASKFAAGNVSPTVILTGDPSVFPLILPGMINGQGISGFPSGYWAMSEEIADSGKNWQSYSVTTSNSTNVTSYANLTSNYRQLSNMVEWALSCQFDAAAAGTIVTITPPVTPNSAQYTGLFTDAPFYSLYVSNGAGTVPTAAGWTSGGKFYIAVPAAGNWSTSGNNNAMTFQVSYHI